MVVDALVWALASQADLPPAARSVGARIVWAIDRRILVDEVHAHASALAERLLTARDCEDDPLHRTAIRLSAMSGDVPLVATRWRGGIASDRSLHAPTQAQVITSTVAQVGSRLLFRGYGVGRRSLSVEAGLAACDTTICLG
jgi:CRISPR-associated endonuclease/helicase Cas3